MSRAHVSKEVRRAFARRLQKAREKLGTQRHVAEEILGIPLPTLISWENAQAYPQAAALILLEDRIFKPTNGLQ